MTNAVIPIVFLMAFASGYLFAKPSTAPGLLLPGWFCSSCRAFNGAAKETLTHCRACGTKAP